jgi:transketolase
MAAVAIFGWRDLFEPEPAPYDEWIDRPSGRGLDSSRRGRSRIPWGSLMSWTPDATDHLCINTIRTLSIDAVQRAESGHPGLPLGAAPMAYVLWRRHLKFDPSAPDWPDRDRFVLSAGHGSMLIYSLLHLAGFDLGVEEVLRFRQWGSITPGHPEAHLTPGVEATTGPLGQGTAIAVGMAIAERVLAQRFETAEGPLFDHSTFALVSDGDLMEGVAAEAASLAGHLGLGRLVYLYDSNDVSLDGPTSMAFTEDVGARYKAYGWQVLEVEDGDRDLKAIDQAIRAARAERERPSLIVVRTTIGFGSPNKSGRAEAHGSPLGEEEIRLTKRELGWDPGASFFVPDEVRARFAESASCGREAHAEWLRRLNSLKAAEPERASELERALNWSTADGWDAGLPEWTPGEKVATRVAAGEALQALAASVPELVGGDADLSGSTKTRIGFSGDFSSENGGGRNLRFGVREHAMGAISNGMAYHGGVRPYTATFLQFSDYMRPTLRLAAMDRLPVVHVWTHDSIGLGEDGPTHQPIEHVTALRAIPGLHVIRPADANEAAAAWRCAVERTDGPTGLVLSRQGLPVLEGSRELASRGVARGAYVLEEAGGGSPHALLIATGSEVALAVEARRQLDGEGIPVRVVSMPCWERFEQQTAAYRDDVLPPAVKARVAVEAGVSIAWHRWVGERGKIIGIDKFGASAPAPVLFEKYGFTADALVRAVKALL